MAEYQITPYVVKVTASGDPDNPRLMGSVNASAETSAAVTAVDVVAHTFAKMRGESTPRLRSDDPDRALLVEDVCSSDRQVHALVQLGVSGYTSEMHLEAAGSERIQRQTGDREWFRLRVVFTAQPSMRAGVLLVEGLGNLGIVTHVSTLMKAAVRRNVPGVVLHIDPVQEAKAWEEVFQQLSVQAIEFRSLVQTGDIADGAGTNTKPQPLQRSVTIKRRGGLGSLQSLFGRTPKQVATAFGVGKDVEDGAIAVAKVQMPNGGTRKINLNDNRVASLAYPVDRQNPFDPPSDAEFYHVADGILDDIRVGVGLGSSRVVPPSDPQSMMVRSEADEGWEVPNEVLPD